MQHKLYLFLTFVFVIGLSSYAISHPITSDCRNPEACYDCHSGHIITNHNCYLCHDDDGEPPFEEHPFPVPAESDCKECHTHPYPPSTFRRDCVDCHDPDGDPPFVHPDLDYLDPPAPPDPETPCETCHIFEHVGTPPIDCDSCHASIPDVDTQCKTCHTDPADANKYDLGCERGGWSLTGPMDYARFIHAGSFLNDNRFLVTGGGTPPFFFPVNTAEILDPATRLFSLSGGTMSDPRWSHTQTPLADGKVLVIGGRNFQSPAIPGAKVLDSADIYDPGTDTFTPTGNMVVPRRSHKAILLDDGRVLVTGGGDSVSTAATMPLDTAEIYDPVTGSFTLLTSTMTVPRQYHSMVKLTDGTVLVIGGALGPGLSNITASVDMFDPVTETFTEIGQMNFPRITQVATLLRDGRVLLAFSWDGIDVANNSEIYDPATNTFTLTSANPVHGKVDLHGIRMLDGTVVCPTGGNEQLDALPDTTIYRPETDDFVLAGSVQFPRTAAVPGLLNDGRPLLVGGFGEGVFHAIASIYTPSILSQTSGFRNVIADLPNEAFMDCPSDEVEECDGDFDFDADVDGGDASTFKVDFGRNSFNNHCSIINPCIPDFDSDGDIDGADASKFKHNFGRNGYHKPCSTKKTFLKMANHIINKLDNCNKCHGGDAIQDKMQEYEKARETLVESIIPRMDGCAGGDPEDDWILGCENQEQPYAVATLMLKTLEVLLGDALPPEATAEVDLPTGEYPHTVQFTGTATDPDGTVALFFWEFGDATISSEQNPMHTYECPGDYTATLTVVDNDGLVGQASVAVHVDYTPGMSASFACDLLPSYQAFCAGCHQGEEADVGLDLTSYENVMAGSDNGPVVIPGDPAGSPIVQITAPPRNHAKDVGGEPLSPETKDKQRAWILEGAMDN